MIGWTLENNLSQTAVVKLTVIWSSGAEVETSNLRDDLYKSQTITQNTTGRTLHDLLKKSFQTSDSHIVLTEIE